MINFPFSWRTMLFGVLIVILVLVCRLAIYYHGKYVSADSLATERQQTIDDMQVRQRDVAALDAKYTKELASAKAENDALQRKLDRGGRVLVSGNCPKQTTGTASLDNGTTVELSPVAGRNVLGIRSGIKSDQSKIAALQQYIREQCLK
ncbi:lysis protein [Pantoea agglomerans]|uniref:lysis protein n=1 Tax=Enterobacter agglomerans TaxID=549 RepID=UPI001F3F0426|nr:lysis protein [Pantoea agglomerans]UIL51536.1 lysis protein [Pantoea agglomerans]